MKNLANALINLHIVSGMSLVVIAIMFLLMMSGYGDRWTIAFLAGILGLVGCGTFILGQFYFKKFAKLIKKQTKGEHVKDENKISN